MKTIKNNLSRLKEIKNEVESFTYSSKTPLRKKVGGHSIIYGILSANNILVRSGSGIFYWNQSIPVTMKLAKTITEQAREKTISYRDNNKKVKAKKVESVPKNVVTKTSFKPKNTKLNTDPVAKRTQPKSEVSVMEPKRTSSSKKPKGRLEFNIGWGFIKLIRD